MNTLTDFLLARIAEDEAAARTATLNHWTIPPEAEVNRAFLAHQLPPRALAECEAKRRIVKIADRLSRHMDMGSATDEDGDAILAALALPYADHLDYRAEWKP